MKIDYVTFFSIFVTDIRRMASISEKIINKIKRGGRDHFVSAADFLDITSDVTARQTLRRLEKCGMLVKINTGLWFYPKALYDVPIEYCKPESIAVELRKRYGVQSVPIPFDWLAGLNVHSENLPLYFTTGPTKQLNLNSECQVTFQHTADFTIFAFSNVKMRNAYICMKLIGRQCLTEEQIAYIKKKIHGAWNASTERDSLLFKTWMRKVIQNEDHEQIFLP